MGVGSPCPLVCNDIVTLRHLFLLVLTRDMQDLSLLVKKNLRRCPKKVIPVQNCMENPFLGGSRTYEGLLETHPNTCWQGLINKRSAEVPQNRKKEYCSFWTFLSKFWAFWALFGAARVLYLPSSQLFIPPLAPLCLSCKERALAVYQTLFLEIIQLGIEKIHMEEDGPKQKGGGWHDHSIFHSMVLTLDRSS